MERRNGGRSIPQFMNMQHLFLKFRIMALFKVKKIVQKLILTFFIQCMVCIIFLQSWSCSKWKRVCYYRFIFVINDNRKKNLDAHEGF
jgi:hypothetical protein